MTAPAAEEIATPARMSLVLETVSPMRAAAYARVTARHAPANASGGTRPNPYVSTPSGAMIAIEAPSAAPDAIPSKKESASGLLKTPW